MALLAAWLTAFIVQGREVRIPLEYPRFHTEKVFSAKQCREIRLRALKELNFAEASVGSGHVGSQSVTSEKQSRRARFAGVPKENFFYSQIYHRLWQLINVTNEKFWRFAVAPGSMEIMQYSIYNASELGLLVDGTYNWHEDVGFHSDTAARVLSVSVQVSNPKNYRGGQLQFRYGDVLVNASQEVGQAIIFPSHVTHRVLPVIKGERHSLVLWLKVDTGGDVQEIQPTCKLQVSHPDGRELSLHWTGKDGSPEDSARAFGVAHGFPQKHLQSITQQLTSAMKKNCMLL